MEGTRNPCYESQQTPLLVLVLRAPTAATFVLQPIHPFRPNPSTIAETFNFASSRLCIYCALQVLTNCRNPSMFGEVIRGESS